MSSLIRLVEYDNDQYSHVYQQFIHHVHFQCRINSSLSRTGSLRHSPQVFSFDLFDKETFSSRILWLERTKSLGRNFK